jgi:hypothetical protein
MRKKYQGKRMKKICLFIRKIIEMVRFAPNES